MQSDSFAYTENMLFINELGSFFDFPILMFLIGAGFFWSITKGTRAIILVVIAIYLSYIFFPLLPLAPFENNRPLLEVSLLRGSIYVIMVIAFAFMLSRVVRPIHSGTTWWRALFLSILAAGFFFFSMLIFIPREAVVQENILPVSSYSRMIFLDSKVLMLFWKIAPLVGIILL